MMAERFEMLIEQKRIRIRQMKAKMRIYVKAKILFNSRRLAKARMQRIAGSC